MTQKMTGLCQILKKNDTKCQNLFDFDKVASTPCVSFVYYFYNLEYQKRSIYLNFGV